MYFVDLVMYILGTNKQVLDQVAPLWTMSLFRTILSTKRKRVYCSFIDYKKAFDRVSVFVVILAK